uniref:Pentraxin (PTX) domain-containing protein n=1 Tax=Leptobrachium leishanense TaxID=445787 RepID=A0A8C5QIZ3_9ANUR
GVGCWLLYSDEPFITDSLFIISLDLSGKAFIFPKETNTAHVILKPETPKPLGKLTVCLRSYTEITREHCLFSLATNGRDNMFVIFQTAPNITGICINQEGRITDSGVIQLWVNGKVYPRKVSNKGFNIPSPASIILGQDRDFYVGGFQASQSFVGEISEVYMWDYVLTLEDIKQVQTNDKMGNFLSWTSFSHEIKGDVLVQPKLQCKCLGYTDSLYYPC